MMGILAPLYLAGLAALSLPVLLHLVRRTPRGRQMFSSLMFLAPTPPRLTRRSRLDQLLLLLLRLGALALLAFAFSRPFLRESATLSLSALPGRQVAILIDTSASLRRAGLWQQALQAASDELDQLGPNDDVALFSFSDRPQRLVDFQQEGDPEAAAKPDIVRTVLASLSPGWGSTDLGRALAGVAAELTASLDRRQSSAEPEIIVISDMQKGTRLEDLQGMEWPPQIRVIPRTVAAAATTNATVRLLPSGDDEAADEPRVRVTNASDSEGDQFFVSWEHSPPAGVAAVYVPPGQSRVVRLPRPVSSQSSDRLVIQGDDHPFDDEFFVVPPRKETVVLAYAGNDSDNDAQGTRYFLGLAVADDPLREVRLVTADVDSGPLPATKLIVASRALSADESTKIRDLVDSGSTLLLVPSDDAAAAAIPSFFDDVSIRDEPAASAPTAEHFALLGEIDFTHPLFAPFSNPRYSDFTKIHFWRHWTFQKATGGMTRIVARFDNGDPAVLERSQGAGRILALAASWRPEDSQLALSSKFVPFIGALLNFAWGRSAALPGVEVGETVLLGTREAPAPTTIQRPDGQNVSLAAETTEYTGADMPGLYQVQSGTQTHEFAVNLPAAESETAPMDLETLEQLGVRFGREQTKAERLDHLRQQRDTELEGRQKIWRWMIALALAILVAETWWAGRAQRQILRPTEALT